MTIDLLRRLSGSTVAALFAVAIAAGCSETRGPVAPSGTGGDVGPIPTSPLCGATNLTAEGGGAAAGGVMPTPAFFSPFQPQYGSTVAAAVPPLCSGTKTRISVSPGSIRPLLLPLPVESEMVFAPDPVMATVTPSPPLGRL